MTISLSLDQASLYKELSVIKDKWRSIGEGLKVPCKHLDQFVGVADPLLEVIVHWLKGVKDTPSSWDFVVATLREPSVNETELADKIYRIYCNHQQEKGETDIQAYSGMQYHEVARVE